MIVLLTSRNETLSATCYSKKLTETVTPIGGNHLSYLIFFFLNHIYLIFIDSPEDHITNHITIHRGSDYMFVLFMLPYKIVCLQ